jgi:tRNA(Arg) A34 adenosine deaminase TadA
LAEAESGFAANDVRRAGVQPSSATMDGAGDLSDDERAFLRRSVVLAGQAHAKGNRPFGAVIVAADGHVLAEAENATVTDNDIASHAEINALRHVCRTHGQQRLVGASAYGNAPPCPMCAGAMMRYGLRRIVFATGWDAMKTGLPTESVAFGADLTRMLSAAEMPIELIGPCLEAEAGEG